MAWIADLSSLSRFLRRDATEITTHLSRLRPTQAAVGMRAVARKQGKIEQQLGCRSALKKYLCKRPIPVVIGPGKDLFIVDRHHLSLALLRADKDKVAVSVLGDMSSLSPAAFFARMEMSGLLHPFDEFGQRIPPRALPANLDALLADPYRDLAWSVRRAGGFEKSQRPYAEFHWAAFFRTRIARALIRTDYDGAVQRGSTLARTKAASGLPGWLG